MGKQHARRAEYLDEGMKSPHQIDWQVLSIWRELAEERMQPAKSSTDRKCDEGGPSESAVSGEVTKNARESNNEKNPSKRAPNMKGHVGREMKEAG